MIKGCLSRIGCLTVLLLLAGGVWYFRDDLLGLFTRSQISAITEISEPSEQAARKAEQKLSRLGDGTSIVRLSQVELQSLLVYRIEPALPAGIEEPLVEVRDSTLVVSSLLRLDRLSGWADTEALKGMLGDSARVTVELAPGVFAAGVARLEVRTLQAGAVVIPSLMVPFVLGALKLPGMEAAGSALLVPAPPEIRSLRVRDGVLELGTEAEAEQESGS